MVSYLHVTFFRISIQLYIFNQNDGTGNATTA
jgi:hypothetical protein